LGRLDNIAKVHAAAMHPVCGLGKY
jgi:hypothetical protein